MQHQGNSEQRIDPVVNLVPIVPSRLAQTQGAEGLASGTPQVSDEIPMSTQYQNPGEQNLVNTGEGSPQAAIMTSATEDPHHSDAESIKSNKFMNITRLVDAVFNCYKKLKNLREPSQKNIPYRLHLKCLLALLCHASLLEKV